MKGQKPRTIPAQLYTFYVPAAGSLKFKDMGNCEVAGISLVTTGFQIISDITFKPRMDKDTPYT